MRKRIFLLLGLAICLEFLVVSLTWSQEVGVSKDEILLGSSLALGGMRVIWGHNINRVRWLI